MAKSFSFLFAILCFVSFVTNARAEPLVLVTLEQPPIVYSENGEAKGLAVEIIKEGFRRIDKPVEFKIFPFARSLSMVENDRADGLFAVVKTPERLEFLDYTDEVLIDQKAVMFVKSTSEINFDGGFEPLKGLRFGILRGATYGPKWVEAMETGIVQDIEEATEYAQNINKLASGRLDIIIGPRLTMLDVIHKEGQASEIKELEPAIESVPTYLAFSKIRNLGEVRQAFNQALKDMKQDGEMEAILNRFFGS